MIFLNYKTYKSGTGQEALTMSRMVDEVSRDTGLKIIPIVQVTDIGDISREVGIEIWSQKIDVAEYGSHTGSVLAESVLEDGARGVVLNHSEDRFDSFETLSKAHDRAREVGLKTLIFTKDLDELKKVLILKPDYVSYEPPSLIGNKDISVATAEPQIIAQAAAITREFSIPLIVGAGVHSSTDVKKCLELGSTGIAVASDVMNAIDPKKELIDLIDGFR